MAENSLPQGAEEFPTFDVFQWPSTETENKKQTSRFASLSSQELDSVVAERHSKKTKQATNWSVSTFKGTILKILNILIKAIGNVCAVKKPLECKHRRV